MMRLASADEKVWRYFLGATSQIQPTLAVTLRSAAAADEAPEASGDQSLLWDVRASALLGAISTAYRRWAATPGSELSALVTTAVDAVIPTITIRRHDSL